jgi:hypothetical protein
MYLHVHTSVCYTIHVLAMYSAQTSPVPVYVLSPFCVPHRCEDVRCTLHSRVERESVLVRSSHARESRDTSGEIIHAVHTVSLARTRTFGCYLTRLVYVGRRQWQVTVASCAP